MPRCRTAYCAPHSHSSALSCPPGKQPLDIPSGRGWKLAGLPDTTPQFLQQLLVDSMRIYNGQKPAVRYRLRLPFANTNPKE